MLDLRNLVNNVGEVEASLRKRRKDSLIPVVHQIVELDRKRRQMLQEVEALKNRRNVASQEIAQAKKNKTDDSALLEEMKTVARTIKELDERVGAVQEKLTTFL